MANKRIYLCLAHMSETGEEQKYIKEAFDTNWVVPLGPNVNGFEKDLEAFCGQNKRVVALSGTDSLWRRPGRRGDRTEFYVLCIKPSRDVSGCNASVRGFGKRDVEYGSGLDGRSHQGPYR